MLPEQVYYKRVFFSVSCKLRRAVGLCRGERRRAGLAPQAQPVERATENVAERPRQVVSPPAGETDAVDPFEEPLVAASPDPLKEPLVCAAPVLLAPLCPDTMLYTVILVSFFMAVGPALMVLNKEILDVVRSGSGFRVQGFGIWFRVCSGFRV